MKHNLITGEKIMTECNALRHFIRLGEHFLRNADCDGFRNMLIEASKHIDCGINCGYCKYDDFGYCGLRGGRQDITDYERDIRYCYPNIVRSWKEDLCQKYGG